MVVTATIEHNDGPQAGRVGLTLIHEDGRYVWQAHAEGGVACLTDVSGETEAKAIAAAQHAWCGEWDLQFNDTDSLTQGAEES